MRPRTPAPRRRPDRRPVRDQVRALLAAGVVLGLGLVHTQAAWTDRATATSGTFSTVVLPAPSLRCEFVSPGRVSVAWSAVSGATSYVVTVRPSGGTAVTTTYTDRTRNHVHTASSNQSGTIALRTTHDVGGTQNWYSAESNVVRYNISTTSASSCSS